MPDLATIRAGLATYEPRREPLPGRPRAEAAVALVLHESRTGRPDILLIERARREGDPWSGQMAFPGGRRDAADPDLQATAARETLEEVGIRLDEPIGQLDELAGTRNPSVPPFVVAPYVYEVGERPKTVLNHEVNAAVWVPLEWILHPDSAVEYRFEQEHFGGSFPAFRYRGFTVWGLTYRVLENFFLVLGRDLPSDERR